MGERSALDRLAICAVVIAGVVEAAQQALANAPAVTKAHPVLKLDPGIWNYVPLAFIATATLFWLMDQGLRLFRPSYARARAAPAAGETPTARATRTLNWDVLGPLLIIVSVVALVGGFIWLIVWGAAQREIGLQAEPQMKFAPTVRGAVTLAFVRQTIQSQDAVSAEASLSKYLGTPMRVSGIVHSSTGGPQGEQMVNLTAPLAVPQVYLLFANASTDVTYRTEGDHIAADCKVERIDASGLGLDGCQLIPDEAWTGAPAK